jgi:hypothetical protein
MARRGEFLPPSKEPASDISGPARSGGGSPESDWNPVTRESVLLVAPSWPGRRKSGYRNALMSPVPSLGLGGVSSQRSSSRDTGSEGGPSAI